MNKTQILLHPQLLDTEELRTLLRQRCLSIPNMDQLDRLALLKLFDGFAVPRAQRNSRASTSKQPNDPPTRGEPVQACDNDVEMLMMESSVDSVTQDCKRIQITTIGRKRQKMAIDDTEPVHRKRQTITWP